MHREKVYTDRLGGNKNPFILLLGQKRMAGKQTLVYKYFQPGDLFYDHLVGSGTTDRS